MAKVKITTKTCPLCGYIYQQEQTYEMVSKEFPVFAFLGDSNVGRKVLVEECTKDVITEGDEDFQKVCKSNDCEDLMFLSDSIVTYGMFCPKCGIFLNHKICTKYKEVKI